MSRRNRRQRRPNLPPEAFNVPADEQRAVRNEAAPASSASNQRTAPTVADLRAEYHTVITDLRLTLSIFAGLIAVMVALSLALR
ncbi:MAG: hypothetical protein ACK4WM_04440 [Thermoflexales bacterium]